MISILEYLIFYIAIDEIVLSYVISIVEYLIFYIAIEEIVLSYMISILEYLIFYSAIDEIVLSYVISILEDLGDDKNAEDNIDVDQFTEMMDAYIPGFGNIDR